MANDLLKVAAEEILQAKRVTAFTGAGISVESGIPPFRGPQGLWSKYDPHSLDINYFRANPVAAWEIIQEIFYNHIKNAVPNDAHIGLAKMESRNLLQSVITQNVDNLHLSAGSRNVIEYHGNSQRLLCLKCNAIYRITEVIIESFPPLCSECHEILKPDFVFFGEPIPFKEHQLALQETSNADVWLLIGTTGEIFPAASLPIEAKFKGKKIIEINIQPSNYTHQITDIFLQGSAVETTQSLLKQLTIL